MSFWSTVGDLAKKAGSAALDEGKDALKRTKEYKEEMPNKSDSELAKIAKRDRSGCPTFPLIVISRMVFVSSTGFLNPIFMFWTIFKTFSHYISL
jgi:hypothetical protein